VSWSLKHAISTVSLTYSAFSEGVHRVDIRPGHSPILISLLVLICGWPRLTYVGTMKLPYEVHPASLSNSIQVPNRFHTLPFLLLHFYNRSCLSSDVVELPEGLAVAVRVALVRITTCKRIIGPSLNLWLFSLTRTRTNTACVTPFHHEHRRCANPHTAFRMAIVGKGIPWQSTFPAWRLASRITRLLTAFSGTFRPSYSLDMIVVTIAAS